MTTATRAGSPGPTPTVGSSRRSGRSRLSSSDDGAPTRPRSLPAPGSRSTRARSNARDLPLAPRLDLVRLHARPRADGPRFDVEVGRRRVGAPASTIRRPAGASATVWGRHLCSSSRSVPDFSTRASLVRRSSVPERFGARYRRSVGRRPHGALRWRTCSPADPADPPAVHGLTFVARDTSNHAPGFAVGPLETKRCP
jgi:hypothetical protein